MSNNIPQTGFCIYINRIRQEQRQGIAFARTVSEYQCFWQGGAIKPLAGQMVERGGPGNNTAQGKRDHVRIRSGSYPLAIADGPHYETSGYEDDHLLPGLLLTNTGKRDGILIHPCHDDDHHYLSSIGCINPASGLDNADSLIDLTDSRNRVIAIIKGLKGKLGQAFPSHGNIVDAVVLINGEPS